MKVDFAEVKKAFLRDHDLQHGTNKYAMDCLEKADKQTGGKWEVKELNRDEVIQIVLPNHRYLKVKGSQPLVPVTGLSVGGTLKRFKKLKNYEKTNIDCWAKMIKSGGSDHVIFLTRQKLIKNQDHDRLSSYPPRTLYHLDGLHRLVAWGLAGKYDDPSFKVKAYIAG